MNWSTGKLSVAFIICASLGTSAAFAADSLGGVKEALARPAIEVREPEKTFLVAAEKAGGRLVLAGERGVILLSDDNGKSWRQAKVPVSVTLTAVSFAGHEVGMATGHGGVVLGTQDGGETWSVLLDGREAARLALEHAKKQQDDIGIRDAELLIEEGPDKPFLDVLLQDQSRAMVVGAYGLAFTTQDGGESWVPIMHRMDNPGLRHFYSIRQHQNQILVAGEQGLINLSHDAGSTFASMDVPYDGSFFTAEILPDGGLIAGGLKGNVWRSYDGGNQWVPVDAAVQASVTDSEVMEDGTLLMSTQAGVFVKLRRNELIPSELKISSPVNGFIGTGNGKLLVMSPDGLRLLDSDVN